MKFEWSANQVKKTGYTEIKGTYGDHTLSVFLAPYKVRAMKETEFNRIIHRLKEALALYYE